GEEGYTPWWQENGRELAGIGYVTLTVHLPRDRAGLPAPGDEAALADLTAAVRWLRRRPDVLPDQVGIVGYARGGAPALALPAAPRVQACVVCDGPLLTDPALLADLHDTPLLALFAGRREDVGPALPAFRKALAGSRSPHKLEVYADAGPGFLGP